MPQNTFTVRMPDGTLIRGIPEGTTQAEVMRRYGLSKGAQPPQGFNDERTASQVASDQAANVLKGIPKAVTGIPSAIGVAGSTLLQLLKRPADPTPILELGKAAAEGIGRPFATVLKGAAALTPYLGDMSTPAPSREEFESAAEGAGTNFAGTALPNVASGISKAAPPVARSVLNKITTPEKLEARGHANTARALAPKTDKAKAAARKIAPELQQQGRVRGKTGSAIDENFQRDLDAAGQRVQVIEDYVSEYGPNTPKAPILDEIDNAIRGMYVEGTEATFHPEAISSLNNLRKQIDNLPDEITPKQLISSRRQIDKAIEDAGGFNIEGPASDRIGMVVRRSVSDMLRRRVNNLNPEMSAANHDYWLSRQAVDIARQRQLKSVGSVAEELPGRGNLLDDILSYSIGSAIGGRTGGVIAETLNLARQLRGYSGAKSRVQQTMADFMRGGSKRGIEAEFVDSTRRPVPPPSRVELPARPEPPRITGRVEPEFPLAPQTGDRFMHKGQMYTYQGPDIGWTVSKGLPSPGQTSVKAPPKPESYRESLKRTGTPQSKGMREQTGTGPLNKQARPATAQEYLKTKGGRQIQSTPEGIAERVVPKGKSQSTSQPASQPTPPPTSSTGLADTLRTIETEQGMTGASAGTPITMHELRKRFNNPSEFESAVKSAVDRGEVWLHPYDHGNALTAAQRTELGLVKIGEKWYTAVSRRL